MKKSFREFHLLKILENFSLEKGPLDKYLSLYFKAHKAIGSKDRKYLAEKIYTLIRWLGLIDFYCQDGNSWEERCNTLDRIHIPKALSNEQIPDHIKVSFPKYLYTLISSHYGKEKAQKICLASNTKAPTTIRANILKTTRFALYDTWKEKFPISLTKHSVFGIQFDGSIHFNALEEFRSGLFEVQDEASQLIADLVDAKPGDLILDYCAGSGGKTLAFAHKLQSKGQIFLHDIREKALVEARRRLKRAGIENAQVLSYDSKQKKELIGKCDWVLVDAPCSGTGTLRRNPDLKWKCDQQHLSELVELQKKIVKQALSYLSPKGKIVYATCSILPQENDHQIDYFIKEFQLDLMTKPFRSFPSEKGMDGFFGAIFAFSKV